MGANAQTTVPTFTVGQILTAAQQNTGARTGVPVFATTVTRDAAFGGANKALAEGQLCYLEASDIVQYYDGAAWATVGPATAGGLVLVSSSTLSAVSSVSINNCFTSTYENYRIVGAFTNASGTGVITARLRAAATDTTTNYTGQITESYTASVSTVLNASGTDDWYVSDINATYLVPSFSFDVYRPQTAQKTTFTGLNIYQNTVALLISQYASGIQTSTTQFDGITFLSSVNITGTIRIYGYANS